jgi:DNA-binding Lrp family transcriptional regulator
MRGFKDLVGDETKYSVLMVLWFRNYVKLNYQMLPGTAMLLMLMDDLKRPITRDEWDSLARQASNASVGRDIMVLESRGFIRRFGVVVEDYRAATNVRGRGLKRSSFRQLTAYRFVITGAGERLCSSWRFNIRKRVEEFCATSVSDYKVYQ